jgi:hypothetical protein
MFEKVLRLAEQTATQTSRRQFLGRFGRGAMSAAAAIGGLLALPTSTHAATDVCGSDSTASCVGKLPGATCNIGSSIGFCDQAPNCTCRTCPTGMLWQTCSNGTKICCRRGYYCYFRNGRASCRRGS